MPEVSYDLLYAAWDHAEGLPDRSGMMPVSRPSAQEALEAGENMLRERGYRSGQLICTTTFTRQFSTKIEAVDVPRT